MPNISVITAAFNEAKNIEACYRSLCDQTLSNFEWIIIDDGSVDDTYNIVRTIIEKHDFEKFSIVYVQQENKGAAEARRNGILNFAKTPLICMLDADDYFSHDALEKANEKINEQIDIVCIRVCFVHKDGKNTDLQSTLNQWPVSGQDAFAECIDSWGISAIFLAKKHIFIKAYGMLGDVIFNNINDDELVSRYCLYSAGMVDICDGYYYYIQNVTSTTRRVNANYHRVSNTALTLDRFIENNIDRVDLKNKSKDNILSVMALLVCRLFLWSFKLDNKKQWLSSILQLSLRINAYHVFKKNKLTLKLIVKLVFVFFIKPVAFLLKVLKK